MRWSPRSAPNDIHHLQHAQVASFFRGVLLLLSSLSAEASRLDEGAVNNTMLLDIDEVPVDTRFRLVSRPPAAEA